MPYSLSDVAESLADCNGIDGLLRTLSNGADSNWDYIWALERTGEICTKDALDSLALGLSVAHSTMCGIISMPGGFNTDSLKRMREIEKTLGQIFDKNSPDVTYRGFSVSKRGYTPYHLVN